MKKKKQTGKALVRVIDRLFGLILAAGIVVVLFGLALEWIIVKGPSPALRDSFTMTMIWTRRFDFIPHIFLSDDEVSEIFNRRFNATTVEATDPSLITINTVH